MLATLYWSNVCVLFKQEKAHVEKVTDELAAQGIELKSEYFGLGNTEELLDRIVRETDIPDIIVSTDLDIYEDEHIFSKFKHKLLPACNLLSIKPFIKQSAIGASELLLPLLVVPLVMVVNRYAWGDEPLPRGYADIRDRKKAFGGRNNSAGKGLMRQLTALKGEAFMDAFLRDATIFDMPVQAFQAVQRGKVPVAIMPSLFAERADGEELVLIYPEEGAVTVPSFIAVKNTLTPDCAKTILHALFSVDFCNMYVRNGHIYPCFEGTDCPRIIDEQHDKFLY